MRIHVSAIGVIAAAIAGCDEPLLEAQRIENTRILGARVEVLGDPGRAWPGPGESARVAWLVADPRPSPSLGWDFEACVGESTLRGVPLCRVAPFAGVRSEGVSPGAPSLVLTFPDAAAFSDSDRVVVRGAVCADAPVELSEPIEDTRCAGDLTLVALDIRLLRDGLSNDNPSLADEVLTLDGTLWPAPSSDLLAQADCVPEQQSAELPLIAADGKSHRVRIGVSAGDREPIATIDGQRPETLQLSHFSTLGRLERPRSVVEPFMSESPVDVSWEAPGPGLERARIARFYFVLRDLRGGSDWTVRTACIAP